MQHFWQKRLSNWLNIYLQALTDGQICYDWNLKRDQEITVKRQDTQTLRWFSPFAVEAASNTELACMYPHLPGLSPARRSLNGNFKHMSQMMGTHVNLKQKSNGKSTTLKFSSEEERGAGTSKFSGTLHIHQRIPFLHTHCFPATGVVWGKCHCCSCCVSE